VDDDMKGSLLRNKRFLAWCIDRYATPLFSLHLYPLIIHNRKLGIWMVQRRTFWLISWRSWCQSVRGHIWKNLLHNLIMHWLEGDKIRMIDPAKTISVLKSLGKIMTLQTQGCNQNKNWINGTFLFFPLQNNLDQYNLTQPNLNLHHYALLGQ
jgi:hypothetical protein